MRFKIKNAAINLQTFKILILNVKRCYINLKRYKCYNKIIILFLIKNMFHH